MLKTALGYVRCTPHRARPESAWCCVVLASLGALGASALISGCSSDGTPAESSNADLQCSTTVAPCGGNITGTWQIASLCSSSAQKATLETTLADEFKGSCSDVKATLVSNAYRSSAGLALKRRQRSRSARPRRT